MHGETLKKVICFLLGNSAACEVYMLKFWNTLSVPSSEAGSCVHPPMKLEQTECYETLAYKLQTPGNYPEESIQQNEVALQLT